MIRINLLPYRTSQKKSAASKQFAIMGVTLFVALGAVAAIYWLTLDKIKTTKEEITKSENELAVLKKKIGEIDNLKKLQAAVQKKLDILNQLRRGKTGPASRLARLSDIIPEKVWLTRYQEAGLKVSISGVSYSEELIADFMRSIQASQEFSDVELQGSEQQEVGGIKLKRFDLTCNIKAAMTEPPKKDEAKK